MDSIINNKYYVKKCFSIVKANLSCKGEEWNNCLDSVSKFRTVLNNAGCFISYLSDDFYLVTTEGGSPTYTTPSGDTMHQNAFENMKNIINELYGCAGSAIDKSSYPSPSSSSLSNAKDNAIYEFGKGAVFSTTNCNDMANFAADDCEEHTLCSAICYAGGTIYYYFLPVDGLLDDFRSWMGGSSLCY